VLPWFAPTVARRAARASTAARRHLLRAELPQPEKQDPNDPAALQELLGGKYGEMSTLNNYVFQSFSFRAKSKPRPFYNIVASITAEEVGHVELVANGCAMLANGPEKDDEKGGEDISKAPFKDMQDIRLAGNLLSQGGSMRPFDSNGHPGPQRRVHDRRPDPGYPFQLPPRIRRAHPQAARL